MRPALHSRHAGVIERRDAGVYGRVLWRGFVHFGVQGDAVRHVDIGIGVGGGGGGGGGGGRGRGGKVICISESCAPVAEIGGDDEDGGRVGEVGG